jgi:beta-lactamase regulating signal transducer with metallopeptidase domain
MEMTVVWALTWLGQSAALAVLTAACVRLPGLRTSAAARHAAWASALVLCAGLPAWPLLPGAAAVPTFQAAPAAVGATVAAPVPFVVLPAAVTQASGWFGWVWGLGAVAGLALASLDAWRVVRLKRQTEPLSTEESARMAAMLSATSSSRAPRVAWCGTIDSPAVLGFFRPVIALPRAQAASLSDTQCRMVLLHEVAHVRRRDDWWVLAERILLAVAWVNPAVHWARRELSLSREMACDEWVVRHTGSPVAYARCLTEVAALRTRTRRLHLVANATGKPGALRRRIVGVLALDGRRLATAPAVAAWMAPVAVAVVAIGMLRLPPVVGIAPPDAAASGTSRDGLAQAAPVVIGEQPPARPSAAVPAVREPGDRPARRFSGARQVAEVPVESAPPTSVTPPSEAAAEQGGGLAPMPLAAVPVPGAGEPGVTSPETVATTFPLPSGSERWWSGPAARGHAAGAAAVAGGRATSSFFARLGSRVPQLINR